METLNTSATREDFEKLVKLVTEENKIYHIQSDKDSAVILSYREYESLQENSRIIVNYWI